VSTGRLFLAIGIAALAAGSGLFVFMRPPQQAALPVIEAPEISSSAVLAASFEDGSGRPRSLAEFQGEVLVVNFWATWCAPCRAEMPAFDRLNERWAERGVRFVGLSAEPHEQAAGFGKALGIRYPLWTSRGDLVPELSRRLGNRMGVLPYTVVLDRSGRVVEQRVGPYTEGDLDRVLRNIGGKTAEPSQTSSNSGITNVGKGSKADSVPN
jgi:thiol-disulfide isomerase/thioredoxin